MGNSSISMAIFNSYVPEGNPIKIPFTQHVPMVFLWFSYGKTSTSIATSSWPLNHQATKDPQQAEETQILSADEKWRPGETWKPKVKNTGKKGTLW